MGREWVTLLSNGASGRGSIAYYIFFMSGEKKVGKKWGQDLAKAACMPREQCHHLLSFAYKTRPSLPFFHNNPTPSVNVRPSHVPFHQANSRPTPQRQTNIMSSDDIVVRALRIPSVFRSHRSLTTLKIYSRAHISTHLSHPSIPLYSALLLPRMNSPVTSSPSTTVPMAVVKASLSAHTMTMPYVSSHPPIDLSPLMYAHLAILFIDSFYREGKWSKSSSSPARFSTHGILP